MPTVFTSQIALGLGAAVLVLRERFAKLDDEIRDDAILRGLRQESIDLRLSELLR